MSSSPPTSRPRVVFATTVPGKQTARMPSPPPPPPLPTYNRRVGFDFFKHDSPSNPSLVEKFHHKDYAPHKLSRTYLCGTDESDYSTFAMEYIIEKLVDDGDEIVCVRVMDDSKAYREVVAAQAEYKLKAESIKKHIQSLLDINNGPGVQVTIELAVGQIGATIDRLVTVHQPISVVVGTRGKSLTNSKFGKDSVSEYLYLHSPVPVIIVRPAEKRKKKFDKRKNDPERRKYLHLYGQSTQNGDEQNTFDRVPEASEGERQAVAEAIGLPSNIDRLEALLEQTRSRAASREPKMMSEDDSEEEVEKQVQQKAKEVEEAIDKAKEEVEEESTDEEDDGEGAPLGRQLSTGSNLHRDYVTHDNDAGEGESDVEPTARFEDMPNYDPEYAKQVERSPSTTNDTDKGKNP